MQIIVPAVFAIVVAIWIGSIYHGTNRAFINREVRRFRKQIRSL